MIMNNAFNNKSEYVYIVLVNKGKNIFKFGKTNNIRKKITKLRNWKRYTSRYKIYNISE